MTSREYFEIRALYREQRQKNKSENFLKNLEKTYKNAQKEIEKDLENFYKRYFDEINNVFDNISRVLSPNESKDFYKRFNEIAAQRGLTQTEIDLLQKTYLEERITRLQALKKQIELQIELLAKSTDISTFDHLKEVYGDSYFDTAHQIYTGDGKRLTQSSGVYPLPEFMSLSFSTLNVNAIETVVSKPWSGHSFSERIWKNKNKTKKEIIQALSVGIAQGHSIDKISRKLSNRMDVAFSAAKRLVRTETNYVMGEATHDTYINAGIEMYEFLATLDYKTSEICRELDGKRFFVKDRKVGVNCNPMHPNCRSTTIPYFPEYEDEEPFRRIARGTDGKTYTIPDNINYKKWFKELSEEEKTKATVITKKKKNKLYDKQQYQRYQEVVAKRNLPKTFDEFQNLKYNSKKEWELLKSYIHSRKSNMVSVWSSFEDYKKYYFKVEDDIVGLKTADGVEIKGQSKHFIERVLGTSYDPNNKKPRSGVEIDLIIDALLNGTSKPSRRDKTVTQYLGNKAKVTVNHETGYLITVAPQ